MYAKGIDTIRDLILYQYAKIISRSTFKRKAGKQGKKKNYGFIKRTFKKLKAGETSWIELTREETQFVQPEKECIYCGVKDNLAQEHIVPESLKISNDCPECGKIQGGHNRVWACGDCNSLKGGLGLYEFYKKMNSNEREFYDIIPPLLEKKYLKTVYSCHECAGTLNRGDLNGDGRLTVMDIDEVLK